MITLGLVADVDADGIYVTLPGSRGVLRGPFETLQNVVAGDKVLVVTTDDGDCVVVGLAAASAPAVVVPDGSITSAKIANGTIVDEDVSASAAIAKTKITGTAITAADTGTVTSTMIADGSIVNADISGSAAIDKTKVSGTAITAADTGTVTNAMLAGSIAASKITGTAITAADAGTVTSTMIANGTIVNEDINAAAAIAVSKLAGHPTSTTDNTVPRFDGTAGALQGSGVTIDDSGNVGGVAGLNVSKAAYAGVQVSSNAGTGPYIQLATAGVGRWDFFRNDETESGSGAGSNLQINRLSDAGGLAGTPIKINRATGRVTFGDVGSTAGLEFGASGPRIMAGSGAPENVVTAPIGSLWLRTNGGAGTTLYVKESGTGNTGWVAK